MTLDEEGLSLHTGCAVPEFESGQRILVQSGSPSVLGTSSNPFSSGWFNLETIDNIPQDAVGWLVAQGWNITDVTYDTTKTPKVPYYDMKRESLKNWVILQDLLQRFVDKDNDALLLNAIRYNDILASWDNMLETSHDHFNQQEVARDEYEVQFVADLAKYMDEIDALIDHNQDVSLADYSLHAPKAEQFLTDLGTAELARINETFAASLAEQLQTLVDKGLSTSIIVVEVKARNTRDRDEQIAAHKDRLSREKLDNEHKLYDQQTRLSEIRHRGIAEKSSQAAARLEGLKSMYDECARLMTYQLDERNKILVGMYGFVERRDDVAPNFEMLVQLATGLGDSGGGWVTP